MLETEAQVVSLHGGEAMVRPTPHSPCGQCDPVHGCRSLSLARMFVLREPLFDGYVLEFEHNLVFEDVPRGGEDDFTVVETIGIPRDFDDDDRAGWLDILCDELRRSLKAGEHPVLTCSALKKKYRDHLREAAPGLGFVFLELTREVAADRVSHRPGHFMPASLIDSQFATLESPKGESLTLALNASEDSVEELAEQTNAWWLKHGFEPSN